MGFLIILEGQYYKGDVIAVGTVSGTVEEVGVRRTTVRAPDGTVHSISNGEIRIASNRTRVYAMAEVNVPGIREGDLERVLGIMDRVGDEVAHDPSFAASIIERPAVALIGDPDDLGMTVTMRGKVAAADRWTVSSELRKRLNRAFLDEGIELNKRGLAP
jgi:small conductance mechanosensitive channel